MIPSLRGICHRLEIEEARVSGEERRHRSDVQDRDAREVDFGSHRGTMLIVRGLCSNLSWSSNRQFTINLLILCGLLNQ
jgi:hypothetical protein